MFLSKDNIKMKPRIKKTDSARNQEDCLTDKKGIETIHLNLESVRNPNFT